MVIKNLILKKNMSNYINKPTQEQRILTLLRERGKFGVMVYDMMMPRPQGLGIAQYSARIWSLRKKGYDIKNVKPGMFVLNSKPVQISLV